MLFLWFFDISDSFKNPKFLLESWVHLALVVFALSHYFNSTFWLKNRSSKFEDSYFNSISFCNLKNNNIWVFPSYARNTQSMVWCSVPVFRVALFLAKKGVLSRVAEEECGTLVVELGRQMPSASVRPNIYICCVRWTLC